MEHTVLERARAGDEQAFRELTDPYRRGLQVHCYRILGSLTDAEDLLQETLIAAWRGLGSRRRHRPSPVTGLATCLREYSVASSDPRRDRQLARAALGQGQPRLISPLTLR